jgi:hypothetical protein
LQPSFSQSAWSFGPYALGVIVTPMFTRAKGSILFHFQMDLPIWPEGPALGELSLAGLAAIVVLIERKSMLRRGQGTPRSWHLPGNAQPVASLFNCCSANITTSTFQDAWPAGD